MADTRKLKALQYLFSTIEYMDDKGPEDEGWQSKEYVEGLVALREVIEEMKDFKGVKNEERS